MAGEKVIHGHVVREHTGRNLRSRANGRTTVDIICPWCGDEVEAHVWSLAGSGKRCCTCKDVIHYTSVSAKRLKGKEHGE